MSKRYGKKRVPNCKCESNFTCRACLDASIPHFTPSEETIGKMLLPKCYRCGRTIGDKEYIHDGGITRHLNACPQ